MKTIMLLFLSSLVSFLSFGQHINPSQIPLAVTKSFNRYFPQASKQEWEKKGNEYEAEFDLKRAGHKALFENSGKLIVYKKEIHQGQLSAAVKQTIKQQYPNYKIDEVELIARNGRVYYQVELDGNPKDLKLVFTRAGQQDNSQAY